MANPNRKMAMMKKIDAITPIEGADRIEAAHIGGWACVVGKGEFSPGELVVFVEPDAFLPTNDPRWASYAERGEKTMTIGKTPTLGHVLRTIRLRGQLSQGLVLKPQDVLYVPEYVYQILYEKKVPLDKMLNVREYHPDQSSLAAGFIAKYDPRVAPRTNCERVQNIDQEVFDLIKRTGYYTSVKVDGTSITACNDPVKGTKRYFSHNHEFSIDKGQGKLVYDTMEKQGLNAFLDAYPGMTLQMELCGPKVANNPLRLKDYRLLVFSVWDMELRQYVQPYELGDSECENAVKNSCVPYVGEGHGDRFLDQFATPQELIDWTSGLKGMVTPGTLDEGVVVHVFDCLPLANDERMKLRNALGDTLQMKSVSSAFLLKKK